MLAAEGLLGHQHANSGWGTFDDDNMVGATAFMETLELALELRRANYGANGERLGFDLYPYTEDAVDVVARSVHQWDFIDAVAGRIDDARPARGAVAQGRGARLRARLRRARRAHPGLDDGERGRRRSRRRHDRRQGAGGGGRRHRRRARREPLRPLAAAAGLVGAGARGLVGRAARRRSPRSAGTRSRASASRARCTAWSRSTSASACCGRRSSGTTSARRPSAPRSSSASASSG